MKFQGKVVIVTGVSGDGQIGQWIAQAFAKEGARLAISARREDKLTARAREIKELGAEVLAVPGDLSEEAAAEDSSLRCAVIKMAQCRFLPSRTVTIKLSEFDYPFTEPAIKPRTK